MNDDLVQKLSIANQELKDRVDILENERERYEHRIDELLQENKKQVRLLTELQTRTSMVHELAHSINSDVNAAVTHLSRLRDNPDINKAYNRVNQIRDLAALFMNFIKRDEIKVSGKMAKVDITERVKEQVMLIKDSISVLRINDDNHEERLLTIEVPIESSGKTYVYIQDEFKESITLILKDLLKNAFKNTDAENPYVGVSVDGSDHAVRIVIVNNRAISESYRDWFNGTPHIDPEMSKSSKLGLRVVKDYVVLLKISAHLIPDYEKGMTTAIITLPRRITT